MVSAISKTTGYLFRVSISSFSTFIYFGFIGKMIKKVVFYPSYYPLIIIWKSKKKYWYYNSRRIVVELAGRPNEKQITFFIDEVEREQFQTLCKSLEMSGANVLRRWVQTALNTGTLELVAAAPDPNKSNISQEQVIKNILTRLNDLEKNTSYLNENQMQFIKDEVLGDSMGTLRNRIGVVENQVQELGGNITRD